MVGPKDLGRKFHPFGGQTADRLRAYPRHETETAHSAEEVLELWSSTLRLASNVRWRTS